MCKSGAFRSKKYWTLEDWMENGFPFSSFPAIFSFGLDQPVCKFSFWTTFLQIVVHDNIFQILQIVLPYRLFTKFANFQSTQIHCILCWLLFWTIFFLQIVVLNNLFANCCFTHRFVNLRTVAPGNFFSSSNCDNIFATWPSVSFFCKFWKMSLQTTLYKLFFRTTPFRIIHKKIICNVIATNQSCYFF